MNHVAITQLDGYGRVVRRASSKAALIGIGRFSDPAQQVSGSPEAVRNSGLTAWFNCRNDHTQSCLGPEVVRSSGIAWGGLIGELVSSAIRKGDMVHQACRAGVFADTSASEGSLYVLIEEVIERVREDYRQKALQAADEIVTSVQAEAAKKEQAADDAIRPARAKASLAEAAANEAIQQTSKTVTNVASQLERWAKVAATFVYWVGVIVLLVAAVLSVPGVFEGVPGSTKLTLSNTPGALGGWITDPQSIKPGVRMPPNRLSCAHAGNHRIRRTDRDKFLPYPPGTRWHCCSRESGHVSPGYWEPRSCG